MKKLVLFSILFLIMSCSSEDTANYSNDPEINQWVKENKNDLENVSLTEFNTNYIGEQQRAIFRLLSPSKRNDLWSEKINLALDKCSNLEDKKLLKKVALFIENFRFDKDFTNKDIYFLNNIIETGKEKCNWSREYIIVTFGTLEVFDPSKENYNIFRIPGGGGLGDDPVCNCRWGWCGGSSVTECHDGDCVDDGKKGCGLLFWQDCTGYCQIQGWN